MIFLFVMALLAWFMFLSWIHTGLNAADQHATTPALPEGKLAIIMVARNEAEHVGHCLQSIARQKMLPPQTVVLLMDDHSEDDTIAIAKASLEVHIPFQLIVQSLEAGNTGKKAGLIKACSAVEADWYILTDADTVWSEYNASELLSQLIDGQNDCCFGRVKGTNDRSLMRWQTFEQLNNSAVNQSFLSRAIPLMVNGGNVAFRAEEPIIPQPCDTIDGQWWKCRFSSRGA